MDHSAADSFLRELDGVLPAPDGLPAMDNGGPEAFARAVLGLDAKPPLHGGPGHWQGDQRQLASLASLVPQQQQQRHSQPGDLFTLLPYPEAQGGPYGVPNLDRVSADAVMHSSLFSHQVAAQDPRLQAGFSFPDLARHSAAAALAVGHSQARPDFGAGASSMGGLPGLPAGNAAESAAAQDLDGLEDGGEALEFSPDELQKQREKNRNAQKRFRQRQKEKMKDSARQLELLTQQMGQLLQEKAELETRNRILEQVVRLNVDHVEALQSNKEVMDIEQGILLDGYAQFVARVERRPELTGEDAKQWKMGDLMREGFQKYIDRIAELHAQAARDPGSPSHAELHELVSLRREHEKQGALFSCFYWAVYAWNVAETAQRSEPLPGSAHWARVLAGLKLSREQEGEMLTARRRLLAKLAAIAERRRAVVSQLGLELLQAGHEQLHACPAVQELRRSLEAEREAVFNFLFTAVDDTLTPAQEAFLDAQSYPVCPDVWEIVGLLAQRRKEPPLPVPSLDVSSPVLAPILPYATAFKLLVTPITAVGIGLRLKRGIVMCPFHTVAPAAAFPLPTQKQLEGRPLLAVQCGRWKRSSYHAWLQLCAAAGAIVSNELRPEDEGYVSP